MKSLGKLKYLAILPVIAVVLFGLLKAFPAKQAGVPLALEKQEAQEQPAIIEIVGLKLVQLKAGLKCPGPETNSEFDPTTGIFEPGEWCFGPLSEQDLQAPVAVVREFPLAGAVEVELPSGRACVSAPGGYTFEQIVAVESETEVTPEVTPISTPPLEPTGPIISAKVIFWSIGILLFVVAIWVTILFVRSPNLIRVEQGFVTLVDRWGKYSRTLKPGRPHPVAPLIESVRATVDMRIQKVKFQGLQLTTKDGATIFVSGVMNFQVTNPETLVYDTDLDPTNLEEGTEGWLRTGLAGVVQNTTFESLRAVEGSVIEETDSRIAPLAKVLSTLGIQPKGLGFTQIIPTDEIARYLEDRMQAQIQAEALLTQAKSEQEAAEMRAKGAAALITETAAALRQKRVKEVTASSIMAILGQLANFQASTTGVEKVIVTGGGGSDINPAIIAAMAALSEPRRSDETARKVLQLLHEEGLSITSDGTIQGVEEVRDEDS